MQQRLHGIRSSKPDQQIRPLPPPLDRSQPCNKRINGLRYAGHYTLLFIREGVLSLAEASSGCLELGVNNSGHYWLHNYKMLGLQNVREFCVLCERGHASDHSRLAYWVGDVTSFTVRPTMQYIVQTSNICIVYTKHYIYINSQSRYIYVVLCSLYSQYSLCRSTSRH